jgi:hypothetical protein
MSKPSLRKYCHNQTGHSHGSLPANTPMQQTAYGAGIGRIFGGSDVPQAAADGQAVGRAPSMLVLPTNLVHMVHLARCLYVMTMSRVMPRYHSPKDYLDAARSSETPPIELRALALSVYDFVVTAVAWNPNTEADILTALVPQHIESWDQQDRARAIAQHPHTPEEALRLLAERLLPILNNGRGHMLGLQAGVALCENPKTP